MSFYAGAENNHDSRVVSGSPMRRGNFFAGAKAIRTSLPFLLALGALNIFPQVAGAAETTETYEIPVTMDYRERNYSDSQCYAIGLATWPEQENAISWKITWKWNGDPRSKTTRPPFDDERFNIATYENATPPAGSHWVVISEGYKSGIENIPIPNCSDALAFQQAGISDVKVEVTVRVEDRSECEALEKRSKRVERKIRSARDGLRRNRVIRRRVRRRRVGASNAVAQYGSAKANKEKAQAQGRGSGPSEGLIERHKDAQDKLDRIEAKLRKHRRSTGSLRLIDKKIALLGDMHRFMRNDFADFRESSCDNAFTYRTSEARQLVATLGSMVASSTKQGKKGMKNRDYKLTIEEWKFQQDLLKRLKELEE
jgi:hypothetical protein